MFCSPHNGVLHGLTPGAIGRQHQYFATRRADGGRHFIQALLVDIHQCESGALIGKQQGRGPAHAAGGPGYQGNFALDGTA